MFSQRSFSVTSKTIPIVDYGIHGDSHRVLGKHLLRGHIKGQRSKVHFRVVLNARQNEENARPLGTAMQ